MPMNARERRDEIARQVLDRGRIQVTELTQQYGVTDTSIRHDLALLEDMGLLRRIHGGAITTSHALLMAERSERMSKMASEKKRIAQAALSFLRPSQVVLMDSGTTVLQLGRIVPPALRRPGALRMVTNSIPLVEEVGAWASPNLLLLGGIFLPEHLATVGPDTLEGLRRITAHCAFLGCDGMTVEAGITTCAPSSSPPRLSKREASACALRCAAYAGPTSANTSVGRRRATHCLPFWATSLRGRLPRSGARWRASLWVTALRWRRSSRA